MKKIRIGGSVEKFTLVSDCDFAAARKIRWHPVGGRGHVGRKFVVGQLQYLHTFILERAKGPRPEGHVCDHVNGDPLDNRRSNLRWATYAQNATNRGRSKGNRLKGVQPKTPLRDGTPRWVARIKHGGVYYHLGQFSDAHSAALAYDRAALALWGRFARLNFPR